MYRIAPSEVKLPRSPRRGAPRLLDDHAHLPELLVAALEQVLGLTTLQVAQRLGDILLEAVGGGVGVAVGAAERLGDDRVNHPELTQVAAGELEALGKLGSPLVAFEQDR